MGNPHGEARFLSIVFILTLGWSRGHPLLQFSLRATNPRRGCSILAAARRELKKGASLPYVRPAPEPPEDEGRPEKEEEAPTRAPRSSASRSGAPPHQPRGTRVVKKIEKVTFSENAGKPERARRKDAMMP